MALRAGAAFVDLVPRLSRAFGRDAERQMSGPLSGLGTKLGSGLGSKIALGLGAGLATAGAGVAAFAFDAGKKLDDALDNIRIKTGLTGAALAGLEGSFRNVAKQVPNDMGQVSDAVAELAQRTGLTGKPLEDLAVKTLTLSRITGKDLSATIEESTRLFGDWGIAVADQGASLDFLFKLSQQTGTGVDFLQQKLVQFGGPLRQLGFSMEESAALIGKFQQEGVNTELVLGSMRQALGRMAKAGEAPAETFRRVTGEIKAAGSAGDANAKALELFGARAGPDMAAAIREGRFEIDGLLESVGASGDSILGAAKDTDGFSETLSRLRNRATLAVEPLATKMVQGLDKLADHAEPVLAAIGDRLPGAFAAVERNVAPVIDVISRVVRAFKVLLGDDGPQGFGEIMDNLLGNSGKYVGLFRSIGEWILKVAGFVRDNLKPILIGLGIALAALVSPVGVVIAGLISAYQHFEAFRTIVDTVVSFLAVTVAPAVAAFAAAVAGSFSDLVGWVQEHWGSIQEAIGHVVETVSFIVEQAIRYLTFLWSTWGDDLLKVASAVWDQVQNIVKTAVDLITGIIELGLALINGDWGKAWDAVKGLVGTAKDYIVRTVQNLIDIVTGIFGGGMDAVETLISGSLDAVVGFFSGIAGRIARAAGDVFGFLWRSFKGAINLVIRGWNNLEFKIPGFDPPGPGPKFGGFTLGLPDVPELRDTGGSTLPGRSYLVGPGLVELFSPGRGHVMSQEKLVDALVGAEERGGAGLFRDVIVPTAVDATADEVVDAINAKLGWKLTTRKDR